MKMYTEAGNAKRAAKQIADKYPGVLAAAPSARCDTAQPMFYPAVTHVFGKEAEAKALCEGPLADVVKYLTEETIETPVPVSTPVPKPMANPKVEKVRQKNIMKAAKALDPAKPKRVTKTAQAIEIIGREGGATSKDLQDQLGWLPHTVRGFISLQNKAWRTAGDKRTIVSTRKESVTIYTIEVAE